MNRDENGKGSFTWIFCLSLWDKSRREWEMLLGSPTIYCGVRFTKSEYLWF